MKNKAFSISLIFISVVMLATAASAAQITKIGAGHDPAISGNMVTWSDGAGSIHVYDLITQKDTTVNSSSSSHPAIYGNKIVWHDESNGTPRLTVYDIPSGAQSYIAQNVDSTSIPKIYGNRIVWGSNGNIYLFDLSTFTQTQIAVGSSPDIYDTIIVYASSGEVPESDYQGIRMYNIDTKEAITICDEGDANAPHIYGNKVIWSDLYTRLGHIKMYDISAKETIDVTNANSFIGEPINSDQGEDTGFGAAIYGDKIVYVKISNDTFGNAGVYVYNVHTGLNSSVINYPADTFVTSNIYGNTTVWGFADPRMTGASDDIDVCNLTATEVTQPPVASFFSNVTSGYAPLDIAFSETSTGVPTKWKWDFGDGNISSDKNPIHTYSSAGNYTITLTVTNSAGSSTVTNYIVVSNYITVAASTQSPTANFTSNVTSGSVPLSVAFTDTSIGMPTLWTWDFGDGSTSTEQNPEHNYSAAGNYTVNLTVSNKDGTNSKFTIINVSKRPVPTLPVADFSSNLVSGFSPLNVQFTDASQNATGRNWDFGDGFTSTEQNPAHTYFLTGTHLVSLIVSNVNGTASKTATITVVGNSGSSGESSSGAGGSAGGSPEPQSNVEVKELSQTFITSGNHAKFDFTQKATPVVYLFFDSKKTAGKTTTIAEMLKGKSTLVSGLPSDEVYKYVNIWVGNSGFATPQNIENAVVCFKVIKAWVRDKKIDKSSITLKRYSDKTWNQLPTSLLSEDDNYLYFTTQTPGFSPFAITGKTTENATGIQPASGNKAQPAVNGTQIKPYTGNATANVEQAPEQTQSSNTSGKQRAKAPGFEIVSGIISLLCVFLYKKR